MHNRLQNIFYSDSHFRRNKGSILRFNPDHIFYLFYGFLRLCTGQINLVDDRKHVQIVIQRHIHICKCLRLHPLCSIYNQNCTITGSKASADFISKVNMSRRINHIQNIFISILCFINQTYRLRFDGNAPFTLDIHIIKYLRLHLPACQYTGFFNHPIRQCGFTMINMCYNAEISDFTLIHIFFQSILYNLFFHRASAFPMSV